MIDSELISLLICPKSNEDLKLASQSCVSSLNEKINRGLVFNQKNDKIVNSFKSGLINKSETYFYPMEDDIPVLLVEKAISLLR